MLPDIQPGNTKILYFFNCLLDGMHTNFLGVLFLIFFVQSGRKCFTAAVYFNPTNQLKKIEDGDRRNRNSGLLL